MSWGDARRRASRWIAPDTAWERNWSANFLIFLIWFAIMGFAGLIAISLHLIGANVMAATQALIGAGGAVTVGFIVWAVVKKSTRVKIAIQWEEKDSVGYDSRDRW